MFEKTFIHTDTKGNTCAHMMIGPWEKNPDDFITQKKIYKSDIAISSKEARKNSKSHIPHAFLKFVIPNRMLERNYARELVFYLSVFRIFTNRTELDQIWSERKSWQREKSTLKMGWIWTVDVEKKKLRTFSPMHLLWGVNWTVAQNVADLSKWSLLFFFSSLPSSYNMTQSRLTYEKAWKKFCACFPYLVNGGTWRSGKSPNPMPYCATFISHNHCFPMLFS